MNKHWPSNEEVVDHKFNDSELDEMTNYDYYLRAALIARELTRDEYLQCEKVLSSFISERGKLSPNGQFHLDEVMIGL